MSLLETISNAINVLRGQRTSNDKLSEANKRLQDQLDAANDTIAKMKATLDAENEDDKEMLAHIEALEGNLDSATKQLNSTNAQLDTLNAQGDALAKELEQHPAVVQSKSDAPFAQPGTEDAKLTATLADDKAGTRFVPHPKEITEVRQDLIKKDQEAIARGEIAAPINTPDQQQIGTTAGNPGGDVGAGSSAEQAAVKNRAAEVAKTGDPDKRQAADKLDEANDAGTKQDVVDDK